MSLAIHLLGSPTVSGAPDHYRFRSQKTWGLLALLLLRERPPTRTWVSSILFGSADDPLRALRWSLTEIRRALGARGSIGGDPLLLDLPKTAEVDVEILARGQWTEAIALPGLGQELLDTVKVRGAPAFESWLLSQRRHFAALSEAILHEAALDSMARGSPAEAIDFAVRAVEMNPLDENSQALLISLYTRAGDDDAADAQLSACRELFERELGSPPGQLVAAARRQPVPPAGHLTDRLSIEATIEAGSAAVSAGAVEAGIGSLRVAAASSDSAGLDDLRITSRLLLAHALIHSLRGQDEEGSAILHEADEIAMSSDMDGLAARARAELGYVDFLRARYDRAEVWLTDALRLADGAPEVVARATAYLGCVASDRGNYPRATSLLKEAVRRAEELKDSRLRAYALSMLGRVNLLRGEFDLAREALDSAIELCERFRWLALLPWPEALRGELAHATGDTTTAATSLGRAFARACQLGDPCWEGIAARGLALTAEAAGDTARAFEMLTDAHRRCNRLADPYVWLEAHILDAKCELGLRAGHPEAPSWIEAMHDLASRTEMAEFIVRSLVHRSSIGDPEDLRTASLLAAEIDNPALHEMLDSHSTR